MKFGVSLGRLNPAFHQAAVLEAEALGFESVWLPEHLVFPVDMAGSPFPGADHPPVPPTTPVYDAFAMLSYYAGLTKNVRLGTHVYLLGLRHPFVAARAKVADEVIGKVTATTGSTFAGAMNATGATFTGGERKAVNCRKL